MASGPQREIMRICTVWISPKCTKGLVDKHLLIQLKKHITRHEVTLFRRPLKQWITVEEERQLKTNVSPLFKRFLSFTVLLPFQTMTIWVKMTASKNIIVFIPSTENSCLHARWSGCTVDFPLSSFLKYVLSGTSYEVNTMPARVTAHINLLESWTTVFAFSVGSGNQWQLVGKQQAQVNIWINVTDGEVVWICSYWVKEVENSV